MEAVSAPEITRARAAVIRCFASASALGALETPPGTSVLRTAPDELLLVGEARDAGALLAAAQQVDDALVVDQSDGWEAFTLAGAGAEEAFRRISAIPLTTLRPSVAQGAVGGVGAKVLAYSDRIVVLVASAVADYFDERIRGAVGGDERT